MARVRETEVVYAVRKGKADSVKDSVRFLRDESGKSESVIVPLEVWNRIVESRIRRRRKGMGKKELKKYFGVMKSSTDPLTFQKKIRGEWK